ncbi:Hsp20/alpha crystallin family protein, partial [Thermodesulfobacteriota bacterium]
TVELPGMTQKDISLEMKDDILTLKGERKLGEGLKDESFLRMERLFGSFERKFVLSSNVDVDHIKASYKEGVLTVTLPVKDESSKKKIKVSSD